MMIFLSTEKYFCPLAKKCETATHSESKWEPKDRSVFESFEPQSERNRMGPKKVEPPWVDDPKRYRVWPATVCRSGEHWWSVANIV